MKKIKKKNLNLKKSLLGLLKVLGQSGLFSNL